MAIEAEGRGRHLLHRGNPTLVGSGRRPSGPGDGFHAGRDHDFEIPLGENGIGIFPVEHLALLGDANLAGKIAHGLRQNGSMSGSSTTPHRAATTVKEA